MTLPKGTPSPFRSTPCPQCGGRMEMMRREPHPTLGLPSELRSYNCAACGHVLADEAIEPGRYFLGRKAAAAPL
ncbi:hypothetical protein STAQ_43860 [Allostella sp. ATCC 35155]|nr:hypothetical protein STAQ_43860 [Stella sp. ATCC 35155]